MNTRSTAAATISAPASARLLACCEVLLILALFFVHAGWPVPEVNETHYLAKAEHYWNPQWCPRDFFLNTADAHQVFYWTWGWLTQYLSLPALAWLGRVFTWAILAWAWRRLSVALVPAPFSSVLTAALFVAGTNRCHMAGEWIIGGFEAKGFAYFFLLLALESMVRGRWKAVAPLLGAASAFHVVIGAWCVVCAGVAYLGDRRRPPPVAMLTSLALGLLLALPGLLPALALTRGVDASLVAQANRLYVFERLPHHLLPQTFPPLFIARQVLLWIGWLVLCRVVRPVAGEKPFRWFVTATIFISLIGFGIAAATAERPLLAAAVLRYYWFRMSDILVPAGVAILTVRWIILRCESGLALGRLALAGALLLAGLHLGAILVARAENPRPLADRNIADLPAWREICDWVAHNTEPDALFITPRLSQSFRWYTGRAEVVSRKDIPQDAAGILEWWRRMLDLYRDPAARSQSGWQRSLTAQGSRRLLAWGEKYDADFIITDAQPPLALELVSPPNPSYAVYRLPRKP